MKKYFLATNRFLRQILASKYFFYATLLLFVLGATWVATTSLYPMAFDEDFHMGLIKIYATSWIPYGIEPHADMAIYGSAVADPSYLFHYIMSFPYRVLATTGLSLDGIVVILRLLNVGMVAVALLVFRRTLGEWGVSRAVTNFTLALLVAIPIFPVIAGQVNYDNLLLIIVALALLFLVRITRSLQTTGKIPAVPTSLLAITILAGMPTKYAFLPLVLCFVLWIIFWMYRTRKRLSFKKKLEHFVRDTRKLKPSVKLLLVGGVSLGLFFSAHYVTNYVQYGSPLPACDKVFNEEACLKYGPWGRDYKLKKSLPNSFEPKSFGGYLTQDWLPGMAQRLTFAVAGPTNGHQTRQPLPLLKLLLITLTTVGAICLFLFALKLRHSQLIWFTLLMCACYLLPLALKLYEAYKETGQAVAVNGRYLLPILPFVTVALIFALQAAANKFKIQKSLPVIATLLLLLILLVGGGVSTYILLAENHWFWQGWGQSTHTALKSLFAVFTIR